MRKSAWGVAFEGTPYILYPKVPYRHRLDWDLTVLARRSRLLAEQYKWMAGKALAYGEMEAYGMLVAYAKAEKRMSKELSAEAQHLRGK